MVCRLLTLSTLFLGNSRHLINLHAVRKRSKLYENHMASPVCREKPDLTPSVLQNGWVPTLGLIPARAVIHFHCPSTQEEGTSCKDAAFLRIRGSCSKERVEGRMGLGSLPWISRPFQAVRVFLIICLSLFPRRVLAARSFPQVPFLDQMLACSLLLLQHCPVGGQPLLAASTGLVTVPL